VTILADFHRMQRGSHDLQAHKSINGVSMVEPLLNLSSKNRCFLFRSPAMTQFEDFVTRGALREACGVQHMKLYLFDDTVIISG
jgi:hypothetical protein